jgi:hypothetical protein
MSESLLMSLPPSKKYVSGRKLDEIFLIGWPDFDFKKTEPSLQEKKRSERDYNVILNFLRLMLKDVQATL